MKTLKQVINVRKIDCQVETDVAFYRGNAKDLLKKISQRELNLHVINLKLKRLSGEKVGISKLLETNGLVIVIR